MKRNFDLLSQDDLLLSSLFGQSEDDRSKKKATPEVTDSEFAQELHFQEVLEVSRVMSVNPSETNTGSSSSVDVTEANPNPSQMQIIDPFEMGVQKDDRSKKKATPEVADSEFSQELHSQAVLEVSRAMSMNPSETNAGSSSSVDVTEANPNPSQTQIIDLVEMGVQKDDGESSESFCETCAERKEAKEMFGIRTVCSHTFCSLCKSRHLDTKVLDNVTTNKCPGLGCEGVLQIDSCRQILPENVLHTWEKLPCEDMFLESQKFYCPFKNCSALLIKDNEDGQVIRECECPYCHRLFCAECSVPWHAGVSCEEFRSLNEDERGSEDLMVRELAKQKKWGRCPKCKFYVERTQGCANITCRCQFQFCYGCGSEWTQNHVCCQGN